MTFKSLDATVRIFHIACLCARVCVCVCVWSWEGGDKERETETEIRDEMRRDAVR